MGWRADQLPPENRWVDFVIGLVAGLFGFLIQFVRESQGQQVSWSAFYLGLLSGVLIWVGLLYLGWVWTS